MSKQSIDIARTVEDADDLYAVVCGNVKDHVIPNRKEPKIGQQVLADLAN